MPVTREELLQSIEKLRQRRASLGELRDYRPGRSKGKVKEAEVSLEDAFSDLFKTGKGGE
ncbi:hypothetical protein [Caudoviricetes sp.]|nr:hypothetical protein [Caudoviricetes sp.]